VSQAVRQGGRRRSGERVGGPAHEAHPESQPADAASEDADEPEVSIGRLPDQLGSRRGDDRIRAGAGGTDEPSGSIGNTNAPGPANEDAPLTSNPNAPRATRPPSPTPPPENSTYTNRPASAPRRPERNVALLSDTIAERVQRAGGRSGDVQVSLAWNNVNDLDLHVVDPRGEEIYYQHRNSRSGGRLDVDMNVTPQTAQPVENVYWPLRGAPRGQYRVMVNHFRNHGGRDPTAFTIRVLVKGQVRSYASTITFGQPKRLICQFDVP
jgi:hypothetical protein